PWLRDDTAWFTCLPILQPARVTALWERQDANFQTGGCTTISRQTGSNRKVHQRASEAAPLKTEMATRLRARQMAGF
ncbi:MAG: hypothetical protein AAGG72_10295, partial [Pseudomonadota bacterium]